MKKKIFGAALIAAMALAAGWNYQQNKQSVELSALTKANVEALARNESGNLCSGGCRVIGWGTSEILRCDCSYTGFLSSCDEWGCM